MPLYMIISVQNSCVCVYVCVCVCARSRVLLQLRTRGDIVPTPLLLHCLFRDDLLLYPSPCPQKSPPKFPECSRAVCPPTKKQYLHGTSNSSIQLNQDSVSRDRKFSGNWCWCNHTTLAWWLWQCFRFCGARWVYILVLFLLLYISEGSELLSHYPSRHLREGLGELCLQQYQSTCAETKISRDPQTAQQNGEPTRGFREW